ncbi:MAG: glycosyltransferase family 4 protein [Minisyncoccia bacterium]
MRVLIVTQVIDKNHSILGFFHRWVEEFAKNCEEVHVVCLYEGEHTLPSNVIIHSLGKNKKEVSSFRYGLRLLKFSWLLRKKYDTVFAHMNPEYVIVGGILWRLLGKEVRFWYAHGAVTAKLYVATFLANIVFTSTQGGFRIVSKKVRVIGQGIDIGHFSELSDQKGKLNLRRLVTVGRITESKRIETLLRAVLLLREEAMPCTLTIIGGPSTSAEEKYLAELKDYVQQHALSDYVIFAGAKTQVLLPSALRESSVFVSDGATGSLDKTLLESAACGLIVISSNQSFKQVILDELPETVFEPQDHVGLATCIRNLAQHDISHILNTQRRLLVESNTISNLVTQIITL